MESLEDYFLSNSDTFQPHIQGKDPGIEPTKQNRFASHERFQHIHMSRKRSLVSSSEKKTDCPILDLEEYLFAKDIGLDHLKYFAKPVPSSSLFPGNGGQKVSALDTEVRSDEVSSTSTACPETPGNTPKIVYYTFSESSDDESTPEGDESSLEAPRCTSTTHDPPLRKNTCNDALINPDASDHSDTSTDAMDSTTEASPFLREKKDSSGSFEGTHKVVDREELNNSVDSMNRRKIEYSFQKIQSLEKWFLENDIFELPSSDLSSESERSEDEEPTTSGKTHLGDDSCLVSPPRTSSTNGSLFKNNTRRVLTGKQIVDQDSKHNNNTNVTSSPGRLPREGKAPKISLERKNNSMTKDLNISRDKSKFRTKRKISGDCSEETQNQEKRRFLKNDNPDMPKSGVRPVQCPSTHSQSREPSERKPTTRGTSKKETFIEAPVTRKVEATFCNDTITRENRGNLNKSADKIASRTKRIKGSVDVISLISSDSESESESEMNCRKHLPQKGGEIRERKSDNALEDGLNYESDTDSLASVDELVQRFTKTQEGEKKSVKSRNPNLCSTRGVDCEGQDLGEVQKRPNSRKISKSFERKRRCSRSYGSKQSKENHSSRSRQSRDSRSSGSRRKSSTSVKENKTNKRVRAKDQESSEKRYPHRSSRKTAVKIDNPPVRNSQKNSQRAKTKSAPTTQTSTIVNKEPKTLLALKETKAREGKKKEHRSVFALSELDHAWNSILPVSDLLNFQKQLYKGRRVCSDSRSGSDAGLSSLFKPQQHPGGVWQAIIDEN